MKVKEKNTINSEEVELDKPDIPKHFEPESINIPKAEKAFDSTISIKITY